MQAVYYNIFKSFLSLGMVGMGGDAVANFTKDALDAIWQSLWRILLFCLPLPAVGLLMKRGIVDCKRAHWPWHIVTALAAVAAHLLAVISLFFCGTEPYSP